MSKKKNTSALQNIQMSTRDMERVHYEITCPDWRFVVRWAGLGILTGFVFLIVAILH